LKSITEFRRRRTANHLEIDTEGSWAISYGDMITLLLSFFIIFFSTDQEKDRMKAMESALLVALGNDKDSTAAPRYPKAQIHNSMT
jgi:flagellar motor protein MotB